MTTLKRKRKPKPGDVFRVRLDSGKYIYGRVTERGGYPFYNKQFDAEEQVDFNSLLQLPLIFRVWVADFAFKSEKWEIVGRLEVKETIKDLPLLFIQDPISKKFSIYNYENYLQPIPASYEDCKDLERAISWGNKSIEKRLEDNVAGRQDKFYEEYKAKQV